MSSRWYPIYQRGNPQLRSFLPDFWMKLVKPKYGDMPQNRIQFVCHNAMSRLDVKNYLEKIYNVPVVSVRIRNQAGETKPAPRKQYIIKEDDFKVAYVTLPKEMKFEFPDLFPAEKKDKEMESERKQIEEMSKLRNEFTARNKSKLNVPGWFS